MPAKYLFRGPGTLELGFVVKMLIIVDCEAWGDSMMVMLEQFVDDNLIKTADTKIHNWDMARPGAGVVISPDICWAGMRSENPYWHSAVLTFPRVERIKNLDFSEAERILRMNGSKYWVAAFLFHHSRSRSGPGHVSFISWGRIYGKL